MKGLPFRGCATALITPMKHDKLDIDAFTRLIEIQIKSGISAIVICGTTGEAPTLSESEKLELFKCAVETAGGRIKIIAGCGSPSTAFTAVLAEKAEKTGVDAILTVTPYYNKGSVHGIAEHYKAVAKKVSLPVIVYNVPSRTGVDIRMQTYEELADMENIVAVKEASGDVTKAERLKSRFGDRFAVYSGNDDLIAPIYSVLGDGVISVISNILPSQTAELCGLCEKGDLIGAAKLQTYLYPMVKALFSDVNPIPVKTAMGLMGLCSNEMRLPLVPPSETAIRSLAEILQVYGLL